MLADPEYLLKPKYVVILAGVLIFVNMVRKYEEGNYEKSTTTFIGIDDGTATGCV